jgi:hypothetical protein
MTRARAGAGRSIKSATAGRPDRRPDPPFRRLAMPRPDKDEDYEDEDDRPRRRRRDDDDDDQERPRRRRRRETDIGEDAGMRMLLPVGRSGWAIAAGYLGLFSVLCLPAPLALIFGILAIREMRRDPKKHGMGRAVFGIVMGSIGTIFLLIGLVGLVMSGAKGFK